MAKIENRVSRTITPASGNTPATQVNPQGATIPQGLGSPGTPDIINKFNRITAAAPHTSVSRSILSRPGNVAEIVVAGIRGTPNDLVDRVLEHGMDDGPIFLALLDQALA